jgi:hypothetical protein
MPRLGSSRARGGGGFTDQGVVDIYGGTRQDPVTSWRRPDNDKDAARQGAEVAYDRGW